MLQILFFINIFIVLTLLTVIYLKVIRPQKQIYDAFRAQGIFGEPFRPVVGQILEVIKHRNKDTLFVYFLELLERHGPVYLFDFGLLTRLNCHEQDLLADVLSRTNASNYSKSSDFSAVFIPLVGHHSLLTMEGNEHERARRMINPAFHHVNLKSMVSIITDRTAKAIQSVFSNDQNSRSVDLQVLFNELTLSITSILSKPTRLSLIAVILNLLACVLVAA